MWYLYSVYAWLPLVEELRNGDLVNLFEPSDFRGYSRQVQDS